MRLRAFGRALAAGLSTVTVASVMLLINGGPATASAATTAAGSSCTGTVTVNGPSVPMKITRPGQTAKRTFCGEVGERISAVITNPVTSDQGCETLTLSGPGPTNISQSGCGNGNAVGVGPVDLTAPGIYTVSFEADVVATATSELWVSTPRTVGTIGINGPAEPMNVIRVGQGVQRTFKGSRGQRVSAVITNVVTSDQGCETLTLFGPGGTNVSQSACGNGNPIGVGPVRLPSKGIYTVRFEVDTTATGHGSLRVST